MSLRQWGLSMSRRYHEPGNTAGTMRPASELRRCLNTSVRTLSLEAV
jgi:hypothetical protein